METVRPRNVHRYGCKPDTLDQRDRLFLHGGAPEVTHLPPSVDLRPTCPPVMDQGDIGSCTAHGTTGAFREILIRTQVGDVPLSRLQLYYDSRVIEGSADSDSGAEIRDVIRSLATTGVAPEDLWPYDTSKFTVKPDASVYTAARKDHAVMYMRVAISAFAIKAALSKGYPVVIGISVYESFESQEVAKTGMVPMPGMNEQMLGGHCMYVVGYGQKEGHFTVRNSWGPSWGDNGDCYIPEEYLGNPNLGADYWILEQVTRG